MQRGEDGIVIGSRIVVVLNSAREIVELVPVGNRAEARYMRM